MDSTGNHLKSFNCVLIAFCMQGELARKEMLGSGQYGTVYKFSDHQQQYAGKTIHKSLFPGQSTSKLSVELLQATEKFLYYYHPNIELFVNAVQLSVDSPPTLLTELLTENLDMFVLKVESKCKDSCQLDVCHDMTSGLQYLHKVGVIHTNLHGRNVLMTSDRRAKIADYISPQVMSNNATTKLPPGNIAYLPPEAIEDKVQYCKQSDIYSLGVLFLQVIIHKIPESTDKAKSSIIAKRKEEIHEAKHSSLFPTLLWCLNSNKSARPYIDQVYKAVEAAKKDPEDMIYILKVSFKKKNYFDK